jgi:hypothetical protein
VFNTHTHTHTHTCIYMVILICFMFLQKWDLQNSSFKCICFQYNQKLGLKLHPRWNYVKAHLNGFFGQSIQIRLLWDIGTSCVSLWNEMHAPPRCTIGKDGSVAKSFSHIIWRHQLLTIIWITITDWIVCKLWYLAVSFRFKNPMIVMYFTCWNLKVGF